MPEVLKRHFGDLVITRGPTHLFLGIDFKIRKDKKVELSMKDQLEEAIASFPEELGKAVSSPSARHLFILDENCEHLHNKQKEIFHSITAKLLFLTKRVRPDIELTVAFLCTRATKSSYTIGKS